MKVNVPESDTLQEINMAFELPDLPYAYDALADKGMSQETLEFHHDLHHKAYVDNGNKLIAGTEWEGKSLEDIITGTYQAGAVAQNGIFNNASQHWNHIQFWEMMGPNGNAMPTELEKAINENFGSTENFKDEFCAAGCAAIWFRLVLACSRKRWQFFKSDKDREWCKSTLLWSNSVAWL